MKKCNKCNKLKGFGSYYKNRTYRDGYAHSCKECVKAYTKAHRKINPESYKAREFRAKNYGMSYKEYKKLVKDQGSACGICAKKVTGNSLHLDHCHKTNLVRGLLCSNCNIGLGHFKDCIDRLQSAADYLYKNGHRSIKEYKI